MNAWRDFFLVHFRTTAAVNDNTLSKEVMVKDFSFSNATGNSLLSLIVINCFEFIKKQDATLDHLVGFFFFYFVSFALGLIFMVKELGEDSVRMQADLYIYMLMFCFVYICLKQLYIYYLHIYRGDKMPCAMKQSALPVQGYFPFTATGSCIVLILYCILTFTGLVVYKISMKVKGRQLGTANINGYFFQAS